MITRNAAQFRQCGDVIESEFRHEYKWCKCGAIAVDGGKDYLRRAARDDFADLIELSESDSLCVKTGVRV